MKNVVAPKKQSNKASPRSRAAKPAPAPFETETDDLFRDLEKLAARYARRAESAQMLEDQDTLVKALAVKCALANIVTAARSWETPRPRDLRTNVALHAPIREGGRFWFALYSEVMEHETEEQRAARFAKSSEVQS